MPTRPNDPAVIRVVLQYREAVAQATELAWALFATLVNKIPPESF